jgi:hypothetical protein
VGDRSVLPTRSTGTRRPWLPNGAAGLRGPGLRLQRVSLVTRGDSAPSSIKAEDRVELPHVVSQEHGH